MEAHSDELPPDVLEEAREKAHAAGLPFYERPYRGDDIDPYTYDGHMSMEDYELMQKLMEQDKEREREPVSEVFSILLHNRQLYEQGKEGLWLSLPTTTEKLQAALRKSASVPTIRRTFSCTTIEARRNAPLRLPRDLVLSADMDELNFLAARLEKLDAAELSELNAALTNPQERLSQHRPDYRLSRQRGFLCAFARCHWHGPVGGLLPEPFRHGGYAGGMESGNFPAPLWPAHCQYRAWLFLPITAILVKSGDEWQRVHEGQPVPEEYRVMAYPQPEADREAFRTEPAAPAAVLPEAGPIILKGKTKDEYMKEITDKLEARCARRSGQREL